jgi:hypothetical protein
LLREGLEDVEYFAILKRLAADLTRDLDSGLMGADDAAAFTSLRDRAETLYGYLDVGAYQMTRVTPVGNTEGFDDPYTTDLELMAWIRRQVGDHIEAIQLAVDADADGMADWWEQHYFGGMQVADGAGDVDGDGASDPAEYAAFTDPWNPASVLHIEDVSANSDITLTWARAPHARYRVSRSRNLHAWDTRARGVSGSGFTYTEPGDGMSPVFYRVELEPAAANWPLDP